ncbi:MAG: hypothetical protein WD825_04750 [Gemmatimonadaceae bacterium]
MHSFSIPTVLVLLIACGTPAERGDTSVVASSGLDSIPAITEGACEGEGCEALYPAVACRDVKLVASPTDAASAGALKPGDTVDVRTDLHLKTPGIVVLKRDHTVPDEWNTGETIPPPLQFAAGDTLLLLNYIGEGFWKGSHKGRHMEVLEFWGGPGQAETGSNDSAQAAIAIGTAPVIETWLRIARGGREVGWWMRDSASAFVPIGDYGEKWGYRCPGAP